EGEGGQPVVAGGGRRAVCGVRRRVVVLVTTEGNHAEAQDDDQDEGEVPHKGGPAAVGATAARRRSPGDLPAGGCLPHGSEDPTGGVGAGGRRAGRSRPRCARPARGRRGGAGAAANPSWSGRRSAAASGGGP